METTKLLISRSLWVVSLTLVLGIGGVSLVVGLGDGVSSSGLFEIGDAQLSIATPGTADILENPLQDGLDWASLFNVDGWPAGDERVAFIADDISLGSGFEGTGLYADGRVYNTTVDPEHDIGYAYVYSTTDSLGNEVLYAAAERLDGGDSSLEFEFNQDYFHLGRGGYGIGEPWEVLGSRQVGDLLVKLSFVSGTLDSTDASMWDGAAWILVSAVAGEGCDETETLCTFGNSSVIDGGPWTLEPLEPNRFFELGVNVGALLAAQPVYTTIRVRTPQDIAFGYFGEGK